jgi:ArsR family transcriptional regulator, arsenate/arsenite/antimonite-responsive transcriptional repressor
MAEERFPVPKRIVSAISSVLVHGPTPSSCITIASNTRSEMPSSKPAANAAPDAKPVRLTHAQRTAILKALSDPKRFELLEKIARAQCPLGCSAAKDALDISPATLSHHIKELQTSGLIDVRREGKFAFLSIKAGVLEALSEYLQSLSKPACATR